MTSLWTLGSRAMGLELIDGPLDSRDELERSFADVAFANRRFGGIAAANHALRGLGARSILDVCCGTGDIVQSLRRKLLAAGHDVSFTCLDNNRDLLEFGAAAGASEDGITYVEGNALALPFADNSFDVAMCNLALHHFEAGSATALLRELRRVSRVAPVVTDLQRSLASFAATYVFSRIFTRNRLTRHDAPLSARRAYTPHEAKQLAAAAGWRKPQVRSFEIIRMVLTDG